MIEHNIECGTGMTPEQKHAVDCLGKVMGDVDESGDMLWNAIIKFQGYPFYTAKNLEFFYIIKGNEMFVTRKDKSITRASVMTAFYKALELGGVVTGPKKLGTFGASYLYPVFQKIGVIKN
ncbi:hypothetical protein [Sporofaciens sp. JLR.KK001]|jgi:hypothetical protein|uniref:hypothetical protein n=1 Tax=Sporofaciens sp. JLR.KK001 TaxID=3112621 RepID=UPI002FF1AA19